MENTSRERHVIKRLKELYYHYHLGGGQSTEEVYDISKYLCENYHEQQQLKEQQKYGSIEPVYHTFEGVQRSSQWDKVRREHLANHPYCAACGYTKQLQVHHIKPYHLFPELELDPTNLITLGVDCPSGNHHYLFGHLHNWRSYNVYVTSDCIAMRNRIKGAKDMDV